MERSGRHLSGDSRTRSFLTTSVTSQAPGHRRNPKLEDRGRDTVLPAQGLSQSSKGFYIRLWGNSEMVIGKREPKKLGEGRAPVPLLSSQIPHEFTLDCTRGCYWKPATNCLKYITAIETEEYHVNFRWDRWFASRYSDLYLLNTNRELTNIPWRLVL
jgi:hypothetical protein